MRGLDRRPHDRNLARALTGITAYTLRYYEKIGVLPKPRRLNGQDAGIRT
ncbi:MerR family DNA-binding transcriptional regulator [Paenibacillus sp. P26]|nr:MerR family DNA-binding transcriptional regulator [Paenibacillus sp. P26]UUZ95095.1 MerR family DNA-binding transcriptional regulator [Paenibacillus sp. P25]